MLILIGPTPTVCEKFRLLLKSIKRILQSDCFKDSSGHYILSIGWLIAARVGRIFLTRTCRVNVAWKREKNIAKMVRKTK